MQYNIAHIEYDIYLCIVIANQCHKYKKYQYQLQIKYDTKGNLRKG